MIGDRADPHRDRRRRRPPRPRRSSIAAGADVLVAGSAVFKGGAAPAYAGRIDAIRRAGAAAARGALLEEVP